MKVERFTIQSCCGSKSIIFKTDKSLDSNLIKLFVSFGYKEYAHFTAAGILYVDNIDYIVTGPLGSNKLQVKCKRKGCDQKLEEFEEFLQKIG